MTFESRLLSLARIICGLFPCERAWQLRTRFIQPTLNHPHLVVRTWPQPTADDAFSMQIKTIDNTHARWLFPLLRAEAREAQLEFLHAQLRCVPKSHMQYDGLKQIYRLLVKYTSPDANYSTAKDAQQQRLTPMPGLSGVESLASGSQTAPGVPAKLEMTQLATAKLRLCCGGRIP